MTVLTDRRVAPFGHLGITACVPLPLASLSLPRPSSPPCAQASPTCLPSLDHNRCSSSRTTRIVSTSDVFLRKSHLNKGFIKSHDLPCFRCQTAQTLTSPRRTGSTIESGWTESVETKAHTNTTPIGGC